MPLPRPRGRCAVPRALVRSLLYLPLAALLFASASSAQEAPPPDPGDLFLHTERFAREDGSAGEVESGLLFVPQDRDRPNEGLIAVVFHRFPAETGAEPGTPPIVRLHGGPGFGGLELEEPGYYERNVAPYAAFTDVVVVGQRGFAPSRPATECEGLRAPIFDRTEPESERTETLRLAVTKCRDFWRGRGLVFEGFDVRDAAADVVDIVRALGYERVTLWGGSFGSHWAMAVMRDHPEVVARALLRGLEGPDHTYDMPSGKLDALRRVAVDAEAAPELAPWIPAGGLIEALRSVVERVKREPVTITVEEPDTGEERRATITAEVLYRVIDGYSSVPDSAHDMAAWPADVLRLHAGQFEGIARRGLPADRESWTRIPNAAFYLLDCASGISERREVELLTDPAVELRGPPAWHYRTACPVWDVDLGDFFRTEFRTDVPTLAVHGDWDLATPYSNALELMPAFSRGKLVTVERGTHGALEEVMEALPDFREQVIRFLRTGDMATIPERVELPPVDWVVPAELPATSARRSSAPHRSAEPVAFVDVDVIPMDGEERILRGQTALVRNGRIERLGPSHAVEVPADARRIDGAGRYLLPGLVDTHVHLRAETELLSYLAHGVTSIVNLSGTTDDAPDPLCLRARITAGEVLGPSLYTTGPVLDGDPPIFGAVSTVVTSPEEARSAVAEQAEAGYDFVKVYNNVAPDVLEAAVAEAHDRGMAVFGHIPRRGGREEALQRALGAGLDVISHGEEYFFTYFHTGVDSLLDRDQVPHRDEARIPTAVEMTKEAGAAVVPNLSFVIMTRRQLDSLEAVLNHPEARYLTDDVRAMWRRYNPTRRSELERFDRRERAKYPFVQALTDSLSEAGVPLLLGTDSSIPGLFPGHSAHLELEELVKAGLTPYEALVTGTSEPGRFLRTHLVAAPRLGRVAPGYRADLLLVREDPLKDVTGASAIEGVMVRGRWLTAAELARMREAAAAEARGRAAPAGR